MTMTLVEYAVLVGFGAGGASPVCNSTRLA